MLSIPIVSSFDNKGIKSAIKEFKQLETVGQKAQFALKKAAVPAAAAFTALAAGLFDATKAALQDDAAQKSLARQLKRSTKATDAQIAANEEWIATQGQLLGVTDDELRPALAGLARVTGSITKAQKGATLAMDIAAAKGVSLESVTKTLERAYGGNLNAIAKLVPELKGLIKEGATAEEVFAALAKKFGGEASAAADTTAGKFKRLKVAMDETKESIGASLIPVVESALPVLQQFADWAQKNPETFKTIALAIGGITLATLAMNAALAVNPYVAATAGVLAYAAAFDKLTEKVNKANKAAGTGISVGGALVGVPGAREKLTSNILGKLFGKDEQSPTNTSPPVLTTNEATLANRGVMIQVNTGVGDPVKIGQEVSNVLDAWSRRGGR